MTRWFNLAAVAAVLACPRASAEDALWSALLSNPATPFTEEQVAALLQRMKDPDVLNDALDALNNPIFGARGAGLHGLLKTLNVRFKAFDTVGSTGATALGLSYSYERSVMNHELDQTVGHPLSLSFNFHARGNVAFDAKKNPDDFLDTGASFSVFSSKGGFEPVGDAQAWADRAQALAIKAAKFKGTPDQLDRSPEWREFAGLVEAQLRSQYFWRAAGNYALESNQSFTSRQHAYGALVSGVIRGWNASSAWARFNVLDWPFAAMRYLTGEDAGFIPSGRALPSVLAGLDQVDPVKNVERLKVDPDKSTYGRWRAEAAMSTHLGHVAGQTIRFIANYRIYEEISPSAAVRAAAMNRFEYFTMGFETKSGMSVTYSTGKLPLDRAADRVFDIGYKFNF